MSEGMEVCEEHEKPAITVSVIVDNEHYDERSSLAISEVEDPIHHYKDHDESPYRAVDPIGHPDESCQSIPTSETDSQQYENTEVPRSHCRFCAAEMNQHDLLDLSTEDIIGKYNKLLLFLQMDVDFSPTNTLPKHACTTCHNMCLETYKFFVNVKKAQEDLNLLYNGNNVRVQTVLVDGTVNKDDTHMGIDVIQNMEIGKEVIKTELEDSYESQVDRASVSSDSEPQYTDMDNPEPSTPKKSSTLRTLLKQPKRELDNEESTSTTLSKRTTYKIKKPVQKTTRKRSEGTVKNVTFSWASYLWSCDHCKAESDTMEDLRLHSRYTHNCCYGFSCVDCNDEFNTFNAFIEHVRTHREYLRLFCQYCNKRCGSRAECSAHAATHWAGARRACDLCGEGFDDIDALKQHKNAYKPKPLTHNTRRKKPRLVEDNLGSWNEYAWTCQDCYQVMPNASTLRAHVRAVHAKCFGAKCADCLRVHRSYGDLVKHVYGHRPNLKHFCQYCNRYYEFPDDLDAHLEEHYSSAQKPCYGCGEIFDSDESLRKHIFEFEAVRRPGPHTEKDVTCDICSKNCLTVGKLKIHRKIHEYKERCFVCDTCGNSYFNYWTYQSHIKIHGERSEICKICKKGFPTKVKLKNHAKTHLDDRPFTCDQCGNAFKTKNKLTRHKMVHTDAKPYVCAICDKSFRQKNGLKVHSAQHTGVRPFQCEFCDRTFTNNPNRDKHMRRRHGVPLYKTKEVPKEVTDKKAKEWLTQVTANQKKRKDTAVQETQTVM